MEELCEVIGEVDRNSSDAEVVGGSFIRVRNEGSHLKTWTRFLKKKKKPWTRIARIVDNEAGGSLGEVYSFSKRSHMEVDCCELPQKKILDSHNSKEEISVVEAASKPCQNQ